MSTHAPREKTDLPYQVISQRHDRVFRTDGTQGGQFTVHIKHKSGVESSFVVPEDNYTPATVHATAMQQVNKVSAVGALPASADTTPGMPQV